MTLPHESEWRELAARSRNVFGTWEWADTWWRHFGEGGELRTRLVPGKAILPLYVSRTGPFRLLRFIGHGHADELGPVAGPEDREAAAGALREALADDGHHLFLGEDLPAGWGDLLPAKVVERTSSPVLELTEPSWDEFLAARSSNFRGQMRKYERRLSREHDAQVRLADDPDRLGERPRRSLRAASCAVAGQPLVRGRGGFSSRLRGSRARAWLAPPVDPRARGPARRGLVRLPLRGDRLVLPGRPRSDPDPRAARSRPHHPHRSGGDRGRDRGVPVPPRRRALQVPVRHLGSWAGDDRGAPRRHGPGRASRAVGAAAPIGVGGAPGGRRAAAPGADRSDPRVRARRRPRREAIPCFGAGGPARASGSALRSWPARMYGPVEREVCPHRREVDAGGDGQRHRAVEPSVEVDQNGLASRRLLELDLGDAEPREIDEERGDLLHERRIDRHRLGAHAAPAGRDDRGALLEGGHDAALAVGKRHVGNEIAFDVSLRRQPRRRPTRGTRRGLPPLRSSRLLRLAVGGASRRTPGPSCGGA